MIISLKRRIAFAFLICTAAVSFLGATKTATLSEVIKPDMMQVREGKLYVLERTSIFIYSLKDFRLIKKFGREGEGPREFRARPYGPPMTISFNGNQLVVNSDIKLSYFSLEGDYIKEEKAPPGAVFFSFKNGYLGIGSALGDDNDRYVCFRLFGPDFQNPIMLYQTEISLNRGRQFRVPMNALNYFPIYDDKIFIVNGKKGFVIDCFDFKGKKLYSIEKKNVERVKVTEKYKESTLAWFENHPLYKQIFPLIKDDIRFKEYFPVIKTIVIDKNRLYVVTHQKRGELWQCIVLDLKGKELKRTAVPLQDIEPFTYYPYLCTVEKGNYYALIENQEDETWELHKKTFR